MIELIILTKFLYGINLSILSIWDHLFGTYKEPPENISIKAGAIEKPYQSYNFFKIIYNDLVDFIMPNKLKV